MKKFVLIALAVVCLGVTACENKQSSDTVVSTQPVYDQVVKTSTLRCGYASWPPLFSIDANTKKMSGIFYDVAEEMGKRLNLKIEWTEETGWGTATESLQNKRFDAVCSGFWVNSTRAQKADFSAPITYSVSNVWVRSNAHYDFKSLADVNNENFSFGAIDGSADMKIVQGRFPKTKRYSMPELVSLGEVLQGLSSGKFDAVAWDDATVSDYLKTNPGSLKKLFPEEPVAIYPTVMLLPMGETKLKAMIDNTIREIQYDGTLETIIEKNHATGLLKLPAKPYQE